MISFQETNPGDREKVLQAELDAFKNNHKVKTLVNDLRDDITAQPLVSLMACDSDKPIGHVFFSRARIKVGWGFCGLRDGAFILSALAVIRDYQNRGIGGKLIQEGLEILEKKDGKRCFVFGFKDYFIKHGFHPDAENAGWPPPCIIPGQDKDIWMWQDLVDDPGDDKGTIICANALMRKQYWTMN